MADPERVAAARGALGRRLASFRVAAGLTQYALAEAVHYTRSTVGNIEVGRQNAPREFWSKCDGLLRAGGALLDGYDQLQQLRTMVNRAEAAATIVGIRGATSGPSARSPLSYVPFQPAALDRPALDWLLGGEPARVTEPSGRVVTDEDVAAASAQLVGLRGRDHRCGAGEVHHVVDAFISGDLRAVLAGTPASSQVTRQMYQVAVGAYELAGYQAVDIGADGVAQRRYLRALSLAGIAGDRAYGAYLLGVSIGHLALHCGHPERGLRMVQTAIHGAARQTTPAVTAALHAVLARAYARLGDESACTAGLLTAEAALGCSEANAEPTWIRYLTPAYLADEVAHCQFDLGHHRDAQRHVAQAISGVARLHTRRRAIDTALLASSLARRAQLDEACARGRDAVDLAARTSSMRCVQRAAQLRVELEPYLSYPPVGEFMEYIREVLPAAA